VGQWLHINGQAIYGTQAGPVQKLSWARTTQRDNLIFLHVFNWPGNGILRLPLHEKIGRAWLLASPKEPLKLAPANGILEIKVPAKMPDPIATVVVLEKKK